MYNLILTILDGFRFVKTLNFNIVLHNNVLIYIV